MDFLYLRIEWIQSQHQDTELLLCNVSRFLCCSRPCKGAILKSFTAGSRCPSRAVPSYGLNVCRRKRIQIVLRTNDLCKSVNSFTPSNEATCQYHTPDSAGVLKHGMPPAGFYPAAGLRLR